MVVNGVRLDQLCCPTCGEPYSLPLIPKAVQDVFDVDAPFREILSMPRRDPYYVVCPNGHQWTLKTIWRIQDHPFDYIQLGEYIGDD